MRTIQTWAASPRNGNCSEPITKSAFRPSTIRIFRELPCYISQAKTGGVSGSLGLAEDPSNFAISCSQVGPIEIPAKLPNQANVFRESTSVFFKATRVTRIWDAKRNTLVYLAVSRRLVDGSPFNAISTVPVKQ